MAATKAQKQTPMKTYGKQTARGNYGEAKAAARKQPKKDAENERKRTRQSLPPRY